MKNIRNFSIISHIDHGKSTLADRFLELTKTIDSKKMQPQFLDMMSLEREKGITIKMQPVQMTYHFQNSKFTLNLIDTPGHVDFGYEVSRALAAVEGTILLIDATKGIQAQTIANLEVAKKQNLIIIPVINKIDLPYAMIEETKKEVVFLLNIDSKEIIEISAKTGENINQVLSAVINKVPSPLETTTDNLKGLIFDSKYDSYKGIIVFVRIFEGKTQKDQKFHLIQSNISGKIKEVGVFKPELSPTKKLDTGEIGYIATGIKKSKKIQIGDTITILNSKSKPLPGYQKQKPMIFLSIYPEASNYGQKGEQSSLMQQRGASLKQSDSKVSAKQESSYSNQNRQQNFGAKRTRACDFDSLRDSLEKLKLNDSAVTFQPESKQGLGHGFQCGFLGLLHAEIITERLKREFNLDLVLSTPSVVYKILTTNNQELLIHTPTDWPNPTQIKKTQELWANLQILTPINYIGFVLKLLKNIRSNHLETIYLETQKAKLIYEIPLSEIIAKNFYDKLKSVSKGFASMNYKILDWRNAELVKLDILILSKQQEAFAKIVLKKEVYEEGIKIVKKLKQYLPAQLFTLPLQAAIGGKIIARETIKARRKDVTAPLYGGDKTRKEKLLKRQKKGKKILKEKAVIKIPPEVFLEIFKT